MFNGMEQEDYEEAWSRLSALAVAYATNDAAAVEHLLEEYQNWDMDERTRLRATGVFIARLIDDLAAERGQSGIEVLQQFARDNRLS